MNSIEYVETLRESLIQQGASKDEIIRKVSRSTIGWPYVFGAWGEECTPAGRRRRINSDHPTIVSACQVLSDKSKSCSGCKWNLPVRMFDCRGFLKWVMEQVGILISGQGCTSQWNTKANWVIRGKISEMPKDKICAIFTGTESKKNHVGIYLGDGSTIECSSGVQWFEKMKSKWTYYAIPAGLYEESDITVPSSKPTLRRGDAGPYVTLAQTELIQRGYDLGTYGADGKFGAKTEQAVKQFQTDWGLEVDGVIGAKTWAMLDSAPTKVLYSVTVPRLSLAEAEELMAKYPGSIMNEERG